MRFPLFARTNLKQSKIVPKSNTIEKKNKKQKNVPKKNKKQNCSSSTSWS